MKLKLKYLLLFVFSILFFFCCSKSFATEETYYSLNYDETTINNLIDCSLLYNNSEYPYFIGFYSTYYNNYEFYYLSKPVTSFSVSDGFLEFLIPDMKSREIRYDLSFVQVANSFYGGRELGLPASLVYLTNFNAPLGNDYNFLSVVTPKTDEPDVPEIIDPEPENPDIPEENDEPNKVEPLVPSFSCTDIQQLCVEQVKSMMHLSGNLIYFEPIGVFSNDSGYSYVVAPLITEYKPKSFNRFVVPTYSPNPEAPVLYYTDINGEERTCSVSFYVFRDSQFITETNNPVDFARCMQLNAESGDFTCDIYIKNSPSDDEQLFFLVSPGEITMEATLPEIYRKVGMEKVMTEIIAIIPVIILTLVGLIGLRKVLVFLQTVLHRS